MKCRILLIGIILFGGLCAYAQTPSASPATSSTPQPRGGRSSDSRPSIDNNREVEDAFLQLRMLELMQNDSATARNKLEDITRKIYRKPNKKEMTALAPAPNYMSNYELFLKQPDTGIVKLNADSSCVEDTNVVVVKEDCLKYTMPGAGTSYSFRMESYRIPRLADLTLSKNVLKADGILQHGIMVSLGNTPLEEINLQTKGLKYLIDFEPIIDFEELKTFDDKLVNGIKADGFVYGVGFYTRPQTTYALRSIAYKGKAMRTVNGVNYNEMDFDKRKDVLVVFRIIDQEENGNITLLWKVLSRKDSPTLKMKKQKEKN